jgi:hypothetical protein
VLYPINLLSRYKKVKPNNINDKIRLCRNFVILEFLFSLDDGIISFTAIDGDINAVIRKIVIGANNLDFSIVPNPFYFL